MRVYIIIFVFCLAAVAAFPNNVQKIVGGSETTIGQYPHMAALLYAWNLINYTQSCGGLIMNNRSILTAAHCLSGDASNRWRVRVGSTQGNRGGVVHTLTNYIIHPDYNQSTLDSDLAIMRLTNNLSFNDNVQRASIAGANFNPSDNEVVWAVGWGATEWQGQGSDQLRHVQIWTVNQDTCVQRYATIDRTVTNNMLCSGWLDVGGRDQCQGDSGGPLYYNGVVVGICSWGEQCALSEFPGVNTRVSRFTSWIQLTV